MTDNATRKKICRLALIFSDISSVFIPASAIYSFVDKTDAYSSVRFRTIFGLVIFTISLLFCFQTIYEQYTKRRSFYDEFREIMQVYIFNSLAAISSLFLFDLSVERDKHIIFLGAVVVSVPIFRYVVRSVLDRFGFWRIDCILIAPRTEFDFARTAIESEFNLGMSVKKSSLENRLLIRLIANNRTEGRRNYSELAAKLKDYYLKIGSPHIIVFAHEKNSVYLPKIVDLLVVTGCSYSLMPEVGGVSLLGSRVSHFFRWELLLITPQDNINRISFKVIKRGVDVLLSLFSILILFIPMIIIFFRIRVDRGPALFIQERVGKNGKLFKCLKFRTMSIDADALLADLLHKNHLAHKQWREIRKLNPDPRVTRFGEFLRRTSLDELPQLFNVLRGDMSMVGPRPITVMEIEKYGNNILIYQKARPGITGLWQISGRSDTTYTFRVALDAWYIKNWSLLYDIAILFKTVSVVIKRSGAY